METVAALPALRIRQAIHRLDMRNHRKIAVVDGRIGYGGSQNIIDPSYGRRRAGPWIDLMARFSGPVVAQLQVVFLEDWASETGHELIAPQLFPQSEPRGNIAAHAIRTGPADEPDIVPKLMISAINSAQRQVVITSPYLVPDEPTMLALSMAAERNVDLSIVVPFRSNYPLGTLAGRACFEPLLESGVKLYLHRGGMLHAKTMTVDDSFAVIGSTNMDTRSFYLNFETNVLMYGPQITREMRFAQMRYIYDARRVELSDWRRRPIWRRYAQNAAALLSPLL